MLRARAVPLRSHLLESLHHPHLRYQQHGLDCLSTARTFLTVSQPGASSRIPPSKLSSRSQLLSFSNTSLFHSRPLASAATTATSTSEISPQDAASQDLISHERVREKFERLGLNPNICKQLTETFPHIEKPSPAQSALIPAVLSPSDLILRAHTGTGKSFGLLLALLSKPRIVFRSSVGSERKYDNGKGKAAEKPPKLQSAVASIILVPSNELAAQYMSWARRLFPPKVLPSLDPVIQCLVRGSQSGLTPEQEQHKLKTNPPHILVGTPGRIKDILDTPGGPYLLGIETLRTLALDEADSILQLPGRFPSQKQRWKHEVHKAPGLEVLNAIMKRRPTYSGGDKHMTAGLEHRPGKRKDEKRPPEHIRRNSYKAAEKTQPETGLALPQPRTPGTTPLQLVCASATANSVMRHFFGARTGWLRIGAKETPGTGSSKSVVKQAQQSGRWIDLTGLSGNSMVFQGLKGLQGNDNSNQGWANELTHKSSMIPPEIEHHCVVVDEAPLSRLLDRIPLRNLKAKMARRRPDKYLPLHETENDAADAQLETFDGINPIQVVRPESDPQDHELDQNLIEAAAFCFASEGVHKGLALIPPRWSLLRTRASLEAMGVTVRTADQANEPVEETDHVLYLLQTTSARGLDVPGLTHVMLIGFSSVIDTVHYTHMAGRVARLGSGVTPSGKVITLIRGVPHKLVDEVTAEGEYREVVSDWEKKMGAIYRHLGVVPRPLDFDLLEVDSQQPVKAADRTAGEAVGEGEAESETSKTESENQEEPMDDNVTTPQKI